MAINKSKKFKSPKAESRKSAKQLAWALAHEGATQAAGVAWRMAKGESLKKAALASALDAVDFGDVGTLLDGARVAKCLVEGDIEEAGWTLAEAGAKKAAYTAATGAAAAAASGIAYAGVGGTLLQAGVCLGVCNPPALVVVAPIVAGFAAVAAVSWIFGWR